jgi:hypothetical protein
LVLWFCFVKESKAVSRASREMIGGEDREGERDLSRGDDISGK